MSSVNFFAVTVDQIPPSAAGLRVKDMMVQWNYGISMEVAYDNLIAAAKRDGYHGIIGIRRVIQQTGAWQQIG